MQRTLFFILCWVPVVLAGDNWENFTNNLATDLVSEDQKLLNGISNNPMSRHP